ncbi:hypothetical protein ACQKWADRAFT_323180 [Trichoderma austrokoningii]
MERRARRKEEEEETRGKNKPCFGYWTKTYHWPDEYAEQSDDDTSHLLARQKSSSSLRRKRSEPASVEPASVTPSSITPSDQKPRDAKSAPYQDPRYETLLATKGSSMQGNRNETRVIRDISLLIVPSAETLANYGAEHLNILIDSTNEGWNNCMPLTSTRPQPDYSVGFRREAFTKDQLDKLSPFVGNFTAGDQSYFMATYYMYFPFLTCEVKCGGSALDIADRQNAHSMTLAIRAIIELFRLVGREMELHREILAFSMSHDHRTVRIYGHYPVIKGKDTAFFRPSIHTFDFTALEGKERWTAYKFSKNIYDIWMPAHFKRLCSAIDKIPADIDFNVPPLPLNSGLSQDLESYRLSEPTELESLSTEPGQRSAGDVGDTTPDTSFTGRGAPKRRRKKPMAGQGT